MSFLINVRSILSIVVVVSSLAMVPGLQAGGCGCPPLWTGFGQYCYRFFTKTLSWLEAENYCREFSVPTCSDGNSDNQSQGHLTSVHSREEFTFLTTLYESLRTKRGSSWVWIGLHDKTNEGSFEWSDGTQVDFTTWVPGQPNNAAGGQDCVKFREQDEYKWHDEQCDNTGVESFVCKIPQW